MQDGGIRRATLWAALFALALFGCSSASHGAAPGASTGDSGVAPAGRPIELFTWWARVGESDTLDALSAEHRRRFPADVLIDATTELSTQARATLRHRMMRNEPPDTFQANAGEDLMQWVIVNGLDASESKLTPLDGLVDEAAEWRRTMPKEVIDVVSYDGHLYGVPTNIHRLNTIFYNRSVFRQYGLSEPKTIDDFHKMAKKLEGTGVSLFGLGSREPWTLALVAFECLLVAREGPSFYESYFSGRAKVDDPRILADLRSLLDLVNLANEDHAQLTWTQAVDLVVRGKAAMTIMGDWARGSFVNRGLKIGDDFVEMPFPQSSNVFVFTSDAFPLPTLAKNREGAIRLLRTMGSVEGQRAMNGAKDALSARMDVAPPDDPVLAKKFALLKKGPLVLALSGLVPVRFADDVAAGLADSLVDHDIEPAVHTLRSRYALLK